MEFAFLGRSGLKISRIIFGNWLNADSQEQRENAVSAIKAALDNGITTFDTADAYGNGSAEQVLSEGLKGQRRESVEIFTKVYWPTGPMGPNDTGLSRKHISESINNSLKRLNTDYVDLYQAHRFDKFTPLEETMTAFADLVRAGKVLYIGVSEWTAEQLIAGKELADQLNIQLISNQPQYSALWRGIERNVIPTSERLGISQIVWSPLAQGVLTGKYLPGQQAPEGSRATTKAGKYMESLMDDKVLTAVQQLKPIADDLGVSMAQLALQWVLATPNVAGAIIGASSPGQVVDNVGALNSQLSQDAKDRVDQVLAEVASLEDNDQTPPQRVS